MRKTCLKQNLASKASELTSAQLRSLHSHIQEACGVLLLKERQRLMSNCALPWIEKYRPTSLSELSEQNHVIETILRLVSKRQLPHLLLYGPPGTGKTTTIGAIARFYYGENIRPMVLELNASDERGIDVVRSEIQSFASSRRLFSAEYKLVILDECDNMTKEAQFALRRIIEKYTQHTRFCLIANYASKIIPALQSRCMKFRFAPFSSVALRKHVEAVAKAEGLSISDEATSTIVEAACGDVRRGINILQSCALSTPGLVDLDVVHGLCSVPRKSDMETLLSSLLTDPVPKLMEAFSTVKSRTGLDLGGILTTLGELVFTLHLTASARSFVVKTLADIQNALTCVPQEKIQLRALVSSFVLLRDMSSTKN